MEASPSTIMTSLSTTTTTTTPLDITTSNVLEDDNHDRVVYSRAATIFAAACAIIFTVVGITGNLLTVVSLVRCPKLRSHATTLFVISLAISDLMFSAINMPLTASRYIHEDWTFGDMMCRLFPFFFYGNVAASLMNMVAITINRYVLISCHAKYSQIYSRTNISLMIAFVWIFSFGMLVPPLAEVWGRLGHDEKTFSCTILKLNGSSPKKFLMMFGFLMPCIAIICCYSAIFFKVRQSRRNVQQHMNANGTTGHQAGKPANAAQSAQRREDIRLTKMMLTIFVCFLVCFLPLMLVNVADDEVRFPFLHIMASILAWASAVINPFIYAFKNRQYQQAFAKTVCPIAGFGRPASSSDNKRGLNHIHNHRQNQNALAGGAAGTNRGYHHHLSPGGAVIGAGDSSNHELGVSHPTSSNNRTTMTTTGSGGTNRPTNKSLKVEMANPGDAVSTSDYSSFRDAGGVGSSQVRQSKVEDDEELFRHDDEHHPVQEERTVYL